MAQPPANNPSRSALDSVALPQLARKERRRPASFDAGDLPRRSLRHDGATRTAGARPEVDYPIWGKPVPSGLVRSRTRPNLVAITT